MKAFQKLKDNFGDLVLGLVIVMFPISIAITNVVVVALVIWWLVTTKPEEFRKRFAEKRTGILVCIAPVVFMLLTLTYTTDLKSGLHSIEKSLLLFIFPLLICTANFKRSVDFFLHLFAGVIATMCLICLSAGLYRFVFKDPSTLPLVGDLFTSVPTRWNALTSSNLTVPFTLNPIYFSLYVSFSLLIITLRTHLEIPYRILLFLILLIFQILLGSRIGIAAMAVAGVICIYFISRGSRRYYVMAVAACIVAMALSVVVNPVLRKRYGAELVAWKIPDDVSRWNAINLRNAVWTCSAKVFAESPVFGRGVGATATPRELCYRTYSFYGVFGTDLNSHNQYIEYALTGGIILLGLFIVQLTYSFRIAVARHHSIHLLFLVVFAVVAFGESLLEAHKGIVFFSCFNSMFIFRSEISEPNA